MEEDRDTLSIPGLDVPTTAVVVQQEVSSVSPAVTENHQTGISHFSAERNLEQSCINDGRRSTLEGLTKNGTERTCQPGLESNYDLDAQTVSASQGTHALAHPTTVSQQPSVKVETVPPLSASVSERIESKVDGKALMSAGVQSQTDGKILHENMSGVDCQVGAKGESSYNSFLDDIVQAERLDSLQDAGERQMHEGGLSATGHAASAEKQVSDKLGTANEVKCGTEYLDGVISSIQSLTCNQPDADKDTVRISRAELTLMVEQTLAAQTMYNYMDDLVQKNKTLNQQNEVLKDTIVQIRQWQGGKLNSLPLISKGTEVQVFRFPGSFPPYIQSSASGYGTSPPACQNNGQHPVEQEATSLLQADGDMSASLQLSSQISLDGDPDHSKEASAAGQLIHPVHTMNNTEAGAAVLAQLQPLNNIPNTSLFVEAHCYSQGPQQHEEGVASAGVSQERFKIVTDHLEKCLRFVNKLTKEGGIQPDCVLELADLRDKVNSLQKENASLKIELSNRCVPGKEDSAGQSVQQLQAEIRNLNAKLQQQKAREDELAHHLGKLGAEYKLLKSGGTRPPSQPSSSVGPQALPTIPTTTGIRTTVKCQTEESFVGIRELAAEADSKQKALCQYYQSELARLNGQLIQTQTHETELIKAVEKLHRELTATNEDNAHLQRSFREKIQKLTKNCEELAQQLVGLNSENDRQNRKLSQEAERNNQLEKIIGDERKRYSRDEKELLDRVKMLQEMTKELPKLKRLLLAVDKARLEGTPLSQDCADQVTALRNQNSRDTPATTHSSALRTASPRRGASGVSSGSSVTQSARMSSASRVSSRSSALQGNGHGTPGHSSGRGSSPNLHAQVNTAPSASLPNLSGQHLQQYAGQATSQGNTNRPLQRNNLTNSASSVSSSVNSSKQRHQY